MSIKDCIKIKNNLSPEDAELFATHFKDLVDGGVPNEDAYAQAAELVMESILEERNTLAEEIREAGGYLEDASIEGLLTPEVPRGAERRADGEKRQERRMDKVSRKRVSDMTETEKDKALLTNEKSGLHNERAYEEDDRLDYQSFFDIDNFKEINTQYTYDGADQILTAFGEVIQGAEQEGVTAYHLHGDEFIVQSNSETDLKAFSEKIQSELYGREIQIDLPGVEIKTATNIGASYGIGKTKEQAETSLKKDKDARAEAGLRSERGREPGGLPEAVAEGEGVEVTEKPLYSRKAEPETRFSALHNLTAENLKFADEIGGFAVPSIGVVTGEMGIEGMGEITLIGTKDLGDPTQVEVYDADAYTSTFPTPEYKKAKSAESMRLVNEIRPFVDKYSRSRYAIDVTFDETYNYARPQKVIDEWMRNNGIKAMYLKEITGRGTIPVMRDKPLNYSGISDSKWIMAFFKSIPEGVWNKGANSEEQIQARKDIVEPFTKALKNQYEDHSDVLVDRFLDSAISDGEMNFSAFDRLRNDQKSIGEIEIDDIKTQERLDRKLKGKEIRFQKWVTDKIMGIMGEPLLTVGRKKVPYSLENIVKQMTIGVTQGAEKTMTFGGGQARAAAAKRFDSLQWMRNEAKTGLKQKSELEEARKLAEKKMEKYRDAALDYYTIKDWKGNIDTWEGLDDSMKALSKWAKSRSRRGSKTAMKQALSSTYFKGVPDHVIQLGIEAGEAMLDAPVPYFEAKPQRAVGLDEFVGAVVPKDVSKETLAILEKHGIEVKKYGERFDEEARTKATIALRKKLSKKEDVLFSRQKATGTKKAQVDNWISKPKSKLGNWISAEVVQTVDELPEGPHPGDVRGMRIGDTVYLVADNITDSKDSMLVLSHEVVGHAGLERLLGKAGMASLVKQVQQYKRDGKKEITDIIDGLKKAYVDESGKYNLSQAEESKEVMAKLAEVNPDFGFVRRTLNKIKFWLTRHGFGRFVDFDNVHLESLLIRAAQTSQTDYSGFMEDGAPSYVAIDPVIGGPENILYSRKPQKSNLGLEDETLKDLLIRQLQDGFNRVKELQKTIKDSGGIITEENNIYLAEERSSGIIAARLDDLKDNSITPLVDKMKKTGITLAQLDQFTMAMHAYERNEYIAEINAKMPEAGSGLTDAQATKILDNFEKEGLTEKLQSLADIVYDINETALASLYEAGLIDDETFNAYREQYDYYVPLKGKEGQEDRAATGQGYSVMGAGLKSAMGRGEGNIAESPVAHSIAQAETAIIRAEKSKIGKALVELMKDNPDPKFWTLTKRNYNKFISMEGEVFEGFEELPETLIEDQDVMRVKAITPRERKLAKLEDRKPEAKIVYKLDPSYKFRDDVFSVMIEGKLHQITIKDKVLAEQLKKLNTNELNHVIRGMGSVNRYLAMINTAINPEFVITNLERDIQTAGINIAGEHSIKMAKQVLRDTPKAARGIWQYMFNKKKAKDNEWSKLFDELRHEGGTIGFFGLEDIQTKVNKIENSLKYNETYLGKTKAGLAKVRDVILDANQSVENAARLSAYKAGRDAGMSKKQAASLSKNLTVNFNRRGEAAPVINSAYLFANASIQGSFRIFSALQHPRVRKIVGGIAATAFALAAYNAASGGDDDDDISHWEKISDYTKQTNLIIMHPDGSGDYFKFKLPYGYNVFWYAGYAMHDLMFGKNTSVLKTSANMMSAAMNAFNPLQGSDLLDTITPTVLKPMVQSERNLNFMNTPIKPENPYDRYDRPESDKAFNSTNPQLKEFAKIMNRLSFGDDTKSGWVDVSPETMKHYLGWITGGAGMTVYRGLSGIGKVATGEDVQAKDIPFIRTLGGTVGTHYDTQRFYETVKEIEATVEQVKIYRQNKDDRLGEYRSKNRKIIGLRKAIVIQKKRIKSLRDRRNKAYRDGDYDLAKDYGQRIAKEMRRLISRYDEAKKN